MGALDGRIAIITGAGRGIGREYALLFAAEGAKVVVNDLGGSLDGSGDDVSAAQQVVDEITAAGGEAVANHDDVTDWEGGKRLIDTAIETFGDLHVLVNNAGILRDRVLVNMSEEEWDAVIHVHLKGHFVPTRHAAAYWREQTKAGKEVKASVINTSSTSGLLGNPGPDQLRRGQGRHRRLHHHRRHRAVPLRGAGQRAGPQRPHPDDRGDPGPGRHRGRPRGRRAPSTPGTRPTSPRWSPTSPPRRARPPARCTSSSAAQVRLFQPWTLTDTIEKDDRWTVAELQAEMHKLGG